MSDHGSNVTPINKEAMAELIAMREQAAAHSAANAPVLTAEGYPAPPGNVAPPRPPPTPPPPLPPPLCVSSLAQRLSLCVRLSQR